MLFYKLQFHNMFQIMDMWKPFLRNEMLANIPYYSQYNKYFYYWPSKTY